MGNQDDNVPDEKTAVEEVVEEVEAPEVVAHSDAEEQPSVCTECLFLQSEA